MNKPCIPNLNIVIGYEDEISIELENFLKNDYSCRVVRVKKWTELSVICSIMGIGKNYIIDNPFQEGK